MTDTVNSFHFPSTIKNQTGFPTGKYALNAQSKLFGVACIIGEITGLVIIAIGAAHLLGPTGSTGFIASIASGSVLLCTATGGMIWIVIIYYRNQKKKISSDFPVSDQNVYLSSSPTVAPASPIVTQRPVEQPIKKNLNWLQQQNPTNPIYRQDYTYIRGPAEKAISFKGYSNAKLEQIEKHLEAYEIPLHACPKRPEKSYPMDQAKADAYVASLPVIDQPIAKKAIAHSQYISIATFDIALKQCVEQLNRCLRSHFSVGLACGKSMQWVASLALKDLQILPTSWFPLSSDQGTQFVKIPESLLDISHVSEETLVIFDDCSYSGTQLCNNLRSIDEEVDKGKIPKKLFIVIPYMSQAAIDRYNLFKKNRNPHSILSLQLITSAEKLHCLKDIVPTQEEREQLGTIFSAQFLSIFHTHLNLPGTTTLCWSDWRLPDPLSFEKGFGSTHMLKPNQAGKYVSISPEEYFIPTEIPRPYKLS